MQAWLRCEGDPPPTRTPDPPEPDEQDKDRDDDFPDVPGSEPPPVPIKDPRPTGAPTGPYVS
jgi:hypothetical protein